jgi:hypothetical protein
MAKQPAIRAIKTSTRTMQLKLYSIRRVKLQVRQTSALCKQVGTKQDSIADRVSMNAIHRDSHTKKGGRMSWNDLKGGHIQIECSLTIKAMSFADHACRETNGLSLLRAMTLSVESPHSAENVSFAVMKRMRL